MTEKRFTIDNESDIIEFDWNTNEYVDDFMWGDGKSWDRLCNRLNELYEENKELKAKVDDKEVAVEVECEKLMQKVLDLIDKSLEKDKHYYKMSYEDYLNGRIEVLEELKKELME